MVVVKRAQSSSGRFGADINSIANIGEFFEFPCRTPGLHCVLALHFWELSIRGVLV